MKCFRERDAELKIMLLLRLTQLVESDTLSSKNDQQMRLLKIATLFFQITYRNIVTKKVCQKLKGVDALGLKFELLTCLKFVGSFLNKL
jgi:hypothetical protein